MKYKPQRSRLRIKCSCGKMHPIGTLDVLVTHFYIEPRGCTEGDYWKEGEWQFICPSTQIRNRLLFDDYDLPWRERGERGAGISFVHLFRGEFKTSRDVHDNDDESPGHFNNYYVDEHRARFGLPAKVAK